MCVAAGCTACIYAICKWDLIKSNYDNYVTVMRL